MGCRKSKIEPVIEPTVQYVDRNQTAFEDEIEDDDLNGNMLRPQSLLPDDTIVSQLTGAGDHVKIQAADPQAFSSTFIKQRQQAIENHSYRSIIESWNPTSLPQLAKLVQSFAHGKSIVDRHWIIFYWITHNIAYDTVSYFTKNYADQTAEGVFQNKRGVCAGYANLYKYLCDQLQIPCEIVSGYSKGYGFDNRQGAPTETNHAWNAIQIDGHWYLMESTWGAGHLTKEKIFERQLNVYYFLPRPEEMIYHHLPEQDKWQLLSRSINMQQYMQMPKIHPAYFALKLELISPYNQAHVDLLPNKPYALVLIQAPNDVHLLANLKMDDQKIDGGHRIIFDKRTKFHCCYFAPPSTGKYTVTIYGKQGANENGTHDAAIDLTLNVQRIPTNPLSFPKTWEEYYDLELEILSPRNTHLIKLNDGKGSTQIRVRTPNHVLLHGHLKNENGEKVPGGYRVHYDQRKDVWRCKFAPDRNGLFDALIMATTNAKPNSFTSVVSFKIDAKRIPSPPVSYPLVWEPFYEFNMKIARPHNQSTITMSKNESELEIKIKTNDEADLLGKLTDIDDREVFGGHQIFYDQRAGYWRCKFAPNQPGIYTAHIMAKKKPDRGSYTSAIVFTIDATKVSSKSLSYPETWPLFYNFGLTIIAPKNSGNAVWPENASYAEVLIQAPDDIILSSDIEHNNIKIENGSLTQFDHDKKLWQLLFAPQQTGEHDLNVYAKRIDDNKSKSKIVVKFHLHVTKLGKPMKFPLIYTQFQTNKCRIYTPLQGTLKKGSVVPIHCIIPGAQVVDLKTDDKWLENEGYTNSTLQRQIIVGSKDVTIYGKYGDASNYDGLVKYSVQ